MEQDAEFVEHHGEVVQPRNRVAILDAGAQYVDLIQKTCVRLGYDADVLPLNSEFTAIEEEYSAFFISGGPGNSYTDDAAMPDPAIWSTEKGVFGICYGQQAMAVALGGTVETGAARQNGSIKTNVDIEHPIFNGTKKEVEALFTHGDYVTEVPEGFSVIGEHAIPTRNGSEQRVISAMARGNFVSTQFHPEVLDETPEGYEIIKGFLQGVCDLEPDESLLAEITQYELEHRSSLIAEKAGDRHVIAFASGGIDSTVAVLLAQQAIDPGKLHVYYFDNGFMRDEDNSVIETLQSIGVNITAIDATEDFEQATTSIDGVEHGPLVEVTDPRIKRKIIGKMFADYKDTITAKLGLSADEVMLLQGTNAADRIESGFSKGNKGGTDQIVEHHNQVQEIKDLEERGLLIEPLDDIHKDEIRRLAAAMGLPEEVVWRHPFPGPGNAIRILCAKPGEYEMPSDDSQRRVQEFMALFPGASNYKAQLLPLRSGGVSGDSRSYIMPVALQGEANWEELAEIAKRMTEAVSDSVSRVIYSLTERRLTEPTVSQTTLHRPERRLLRTVDNIVFEEMRSRNLMREISQCPVILVPLSFNEPGQRSIVLRPVRTTTYLTAKAVTGLHVDENFFFDTARRITEEVPNISQVFLELTGKPPGRTEWE